MRDTLRGCLRIGTAVTETALRRAESTARGMLTSLGVDPDEVQRRLAEQVPEPVRHNADLAVGLIRSEAEKAWGRLGDGVVQVGVVLETLERWVRDLEGSGEREAEERVSWSDAESSRPASRAEEAFPRPTSAGPSGPVRVFVDEEPAEEPSSEEQPSSAGEAPARKAPARKAPTRKAPAKTAPAKKAAAKKTAAKTAAKKTTVKKTTVKKTASKKATAQKSTAKKAPAKRAAKKTTRPGSSGSPGE